MNAEIQTTVNVEADVNVSESLMGVADNLISLFSDPWFIVAVFVAFNVGQLVHVILRGYFDDRTRDLDKAIIIWGVQLLVGFAATYYFVDLANVHKYAAITGMFSIMTYYVLRWVAIWRKWPGLMTWLTLRKAWVNEDGKIVKGGTIELLRR